MKMRKLFLSLLISGASLGSVAAQELITTAPAPATNEPATRDASRHIGDEIVPAVAGRGSRIADGVEDASPTDLSYIAPAAMNFQATPQSAYCEGAWDSSAGRNACAPCNDYSPGWWFGAESLLWWGQNRNAPPLMTTSATQVLPIAGDPGVETVAGGIDGISSGILPGYRFSAGRYFGCDQRVGVSGRVFGIFDKNNSTTRSADGANGSIGLPFFNPLIPPQGANDAYLVAFNDGQPFATGTASVNSSLSLLAADASLRYLVGRSCDHHIDLLGGYTFLRLQDSLGVTSHSVDQDTGNITPDGTVFDTNDLFDAKNTFHGGHFGLQSTIVRKRLSLTTLTKFSLGSMQENVSINGSTSVGLPPADPTVTAGGVYSQQSNIGNFSRNTFAFIPEVGVKGGLLVRNNIQLTAGYTFLYISKAALAGNQIDSVIDLTQSQGGVPGNQPAFNYREGSMWFQGLDLGMNWSF